MGAGYRFVNKAAEKAAEFFIYEDVGTDWFGGVSAKDFASDLKAAGAVDRIDVRIASYGGDMNDGLAMYEQLKAHKARVVTHVDGVAASIASVIAMAGDEIVISESGSMMLHEGWTIASGNARRLRAVADQADGMTRMMVNLYAARTGNTPAQIQEWMAADGGVGGTWFYGREAVDAGFATSVSENVRVSANARSLWLSSMQSRVAQRIHLERTNAVKLHPANDDIRAEIAAQAERARARHLTPVT